MKQQGVIDMNASEQFEDNGCQTNDPQNFKFDGMTTYQDNGCQMSYRVDIRLRLVRIETWKVARGFNYYQINVRIKLLLLNIFEDG